MLTQWDQGRHDLPELQVYGPAGSSEMTERLFSETGAFNLDLVARTSHEGSLAFFQARGGTLPRPRPQPVVQELRSGDTVDGTGWTVSVQSVLHQLPICTASAIGSIRQRVRSPIPATAAPAKAWKY